MRAANAFAKAKAILDVGCGPGVFFDTLTAAREPGTFDYVGIEPVLQLADQARQRCGIEASAPTRGVTIVHDANPTGLLEFMAADAPHRPRFDAVLVRHVLEHLREPWQLLAAAANVCGGTLVVVLSRETRLQGIPQPLLTDRELGALRYSHWRLTLLQVIASRGFYVHERATHADGLVPHEEYFELRRRRDVATAPLPAAEPAG